MTTRAARDVRVNLRASYAQTDAIRRAAEATDTTMTQFIMNSAMQAAERVLADRRWFELNDDLWQDFQARLTEPAVLKPRLAVLLNSDDPFVD